MVQLTGEAGGGQTRLCWGTEIIFIPQVILRFASSYEDLVKRIKSEKLL